MGFIQILQLPEFDYKLTDKLNEKGLPIDSRVVDQFYSQPFMKGENGFPKSDVAMFLSTQSDDLKSQIAQRMEELKLEYPDQNLSNEELIALTVDRNIQSAPDFQRWYSQLKDQKLDDYLKSLNITTVEEKETIKYDDDENNKTV